MKNLEVLEHFLKPDDQLTRFLAEPLARSHKRPASPLPNLSLRELFCKIDPSWYAEKLETFSEKDRTFFTSLLEGNFPNGLELHFLNLFFREFFPHDHPLPLSYLSDHPLLFLLEGTQENLYKLCFYLGLFDLSSELKTILDGIILRGLEESLALEELTFCKEAKNLLPLGAMGISQWNGDAKMLRETLSERGLYRLSLGISTASDDFVWYLTHTLEKSSALRLQQFSKPPIDSKMWGIVLTQITTTWRSVCTASS